MTLGLVRHFKVDYPFNNVLVDCEQFAKDMDDYDTASVIHNKVDLKNIDWEVCYCSTMPRAVKTAELIYPGEIIKTGLIEEVPIAPFTKRKFKLPGQAWHVAARIAWYFNKNSQPEVRSFTLQRIEKFLEMLRSSGKSKILIVSHGFFMRVFHNELLKLGFKGEIDTRPRNGKLYLLNKEDPAF